MSMNMSVSSEIVDLVPYQPGKPIAETKRQYGLDRIIKLASNENPLGTSPMVVQALTEGLKDLHRYPDPSCYLLKQSLSQNWHVKTDEIAVGNGSNELIDLLIRIFCAPGESILTIESAFVAYEVCAQAARVKTRHIPLNADYSTNLEAMAVSLRHNREKEKIRLVFLPNPNNPTGHLISSDSLMGFLEEFSNQPDLLIVIDEAYTEFITRPHQKSGMELRKLFPRLVVIRSFSKAYGLAGLRLGVLNGLPEIVAIIDKVRNPFNVNSLAQIAGQAALSDTDYVRRSVELNTRQRTWIESEIEGTLQLPFVSSQANFVFFDVQRPAQKVFEDLLRRGVILRPVRNYGYPTHLRMSVGLAEENKLALETLKEVLI